MPELIQLWANQRQELLIGRCCAGGNLCWRRSQWTSSSPTIKAFLWSSSHVRFSKAPASRVILPLSPSAISSLSLTTVREVPLINLLDFQRWDGWQRIASETNAVGGSPDGWPLPKSLIAKTPNLFWYSLHDNQLYGSTLTPPQQLMQSWLETCHVSFTTALLREVEGLVASRKNPIDRCSIMRDILFQQVFHSLVIGTSSSRTIT